MTQRVLTESELAEAAFLLMSSSSVDRYVRIAKTLAQGSVAQRRVSEEPEAIDQLLQTAKQLWSEVVSSARRDTPEVELAVTLVVLGKTSDERCEDFLRDIGHVALSSAFWISSLARKLLFERPSNNVI